MFLPHTDEVDEPNVHQLVDAIYAGAFETPPWQELLLKFRRQLSAADVTLLAPASYAGPDFHRDALGQAASSRSVGCISTSDPFISIPQDTVVTAIAHFGEHAWLRSDHYQTHLRPRGMFDVLRVDFADGDSRLHRLTAIRRIGHGAFSEEDQSLCRIALPHLKRAAGLRSKVESLERDRLASSHAIDRMLLGMVVLDATGRVLKINGEAKLLLTAGDGLIVNKDRLSARTVEETRSLNRVITKIVSASTQHRAVEALSLSRASNPVKLGLVICRLTHHDAFIPQQHSAVVLFIRDPTRMVDAPVGSLMRLFDLTPRQAQLAAFLMRGLTLNEAARQIGVKRNTVRTHLREIYAKVGVRHQGGLVQTLLNSAVVLN